MTTMYNEHIKIIEGLNSNLVTYANDNNIRLKINPTTEKQNKVLNNS